MNRKMETVKKPWKHRSFKIVLGVALAVVVVMTLLPGNDADRIDPNNAYTCRVERGDLVVSILQSGELQAKSSRDILNEAHSNAKIVELVDDGAFVTNGQLLVELESSELQERYLNQKSAVAEAEASLMLARETLEIAKLKNATDLESAKLKVELAKLDFQKYDEVEYTQMVDKAKSDIYLAEQELKKARSDLQGTQELFKKGFSNQDELDADQLGVERKEIEVKNKTKDLEILEKYTSVKRRKELENAVANDESALERLKKTIISDVTSKEAAIESKKTRLEIVRNQLATREEELENTTIRADFSGQVFYPKAGMSRRSREVTKGATVHLRQKILSFPDLSAWNIRVGIPEAMVDKVAVGQKAVATLDALPGVILHARVEKVSAVPDSQDFFSTGVKTYTLMLAVNDGVEDPLKPGMSATVEIVIDSLVDVLHVPIQWWFPMEINAMFMWCEETAENCARSEPENTIRLVSKLWTASKRGKKFYCMRRSPWRRTASSGKVR
ncbi:MAG: HlyD family secretion protein [Kiritimatiellaceae bacterium]|nr:HlyD family secretion protein [Kiritimatiellaceae bacterium]